MVKKKYDPETQTTYYEGTAGYAKLSQDTSGGSGGGGSSSEAPETPEIKEGPSDRISELAQKKGESGWTPEETAEYMVLGSMHSHYSSSRDPDSTLHTGAVITESGRVYPVTREALGSGGAREIKTAEKIIAYEKTGGEEGYHTYMRKETDLRPDLPSDELGALATGSKEWVAPPPELVDSVYLERMTREGELERVLLPEGITRKDVESGGVEVSDEGDTFSFITKEEKDPDFLSWWTESKEGFKDTVLEKMGLPTSYELAKGENTGALLIDSARQVARGMGEASVDVLAFPYEIGMGAVGSVHYGAESLKEGTLTEKAKTIPHELKENVKHLISPSTYTADPIHSAFLAAFIVTPLGKAGVSKVRGRGTPKIERIETEITPETFQAYADAPPKVRAIIEDQYILPKSEPPYYTKKGPVAEPHPEAHVGYPLEGLKTVEGPPRIYDLRKISPGEIEATTQLFTRGQGGKGMTLVKEDLSTHSLKTKPPEIIEGAPLKGSHEVLKDIGLLETDTGLLDVAITRERAMAYERPSPRVELSPEEVMAQAPDEILGGFRKGAKRKAWVEEDITRHYKLTEEGTIGDLLRTDISRDIIPEEISGGFVGGRGKKTPLKFEYKEGIEDTFGINIEAASDVSISKGRGAPRSSTLRPSRGGSQAQAISDELIVDTFGGFNVKRSITHLKESPRSAGIPGVLGGGATSSLSLSDMREAFNIKVHQEPVLRSGKKGGLIDIGKDLQIFREREIDVKAPIVTVGLIEEGDVDVIITQDIIQVPRQDIRVPSPFFRTPPPDDFFKVMPGENILIPLGGVPRGGPSPRDSGWGFFGGGEIKNPIASAEDIWGIKSPRKKGSKNIFREVM